MPSTTDTAFFASPHTFTLPAEALPFQLESGETLADLHLCYETYGTLNPEGSNAILVCHALTGDAHLALKHHADERKDGWWHALFGEGKAFDASQYFIICSNVLGGCQGSTGPSSLKPHSSERYNADFPSITMGDMVEAQARLLDALGVGRLHAVVGGSMGGMQALEWGLRYPQRVERLALLACCDKLSAQALAFNAVGRHAIMSDPAWKGGDYDANHQPVAGLSTARMMAHITYLSQQGLEDRFGRRRQKMQASTGRETSFAIESYLDYQGTSFLKRFDANTYLSLMAALDAFNAAEAWGDGSLLKAFARIEAACLLVSFDSDWLFTSEQMQGMATALRRNGKDVRFVELSSPAGHDAFLVEHEAVNRILAPFLHAPCSKEDPRHA